MTKKGSFTKKLASIPSGAWSRGFGMAKVSAAMGLKAASHAVSGIFSSEDPEKRLKDLLLSQVGMLTQELGRLKGSLMKVGQSLSVFGEYFLPPEVNQVLKSLQNASPPLEWREMKKALAKELPKERMEELEIDPEPLAAASLGQVHRAVVKATGEVLALKIQYPGVSDAIDGDIQTMKKLLTVKKFFSDPERLEQTFNEVKTMLHQEVNYEIEKELTEAYAQRLSKDSRYVTPVVYPQYSSQRVLATRFQEGVAFDSEGVKALSQERRDQLASAFLDLYFREFLEWAQVQTDGHFGNYKVKLGPPDQLVLFDFGAVRRYSARFVHDYKRLIRACIQGKHSEIFTWAKAVGFLRDEDDENVRVLFAQLCTLILEPFFDPIKEAHFFTPESGLLTDYFDSKTGGYDWGASDLPKRVTKKGAALVVAFRLRPPPPEVIFLDRKLGGTFIALSSLKAKIHGRECLEKYLKE